MPLSILFHHGSGQTNRRQRHRRWATVYGVLALFSLMGAAISAQEGVDLTRLPLGDDKISTQPQRGYLWSCMQQAFGGGAFKDGPWINGDGTWNRLLKASVDGAVEWSNYTFTIEVVEGAQRVFTGNGLPSHTTGIYPIQSSDDAYQYDRNPNAIQEQTLTFTLPANPTLAAQPSCAGGAVGIMITGIPLFNGFDAELRDAVAHEVQDSCGGHPQSSGQYHYHDLSSCIEERETGDTHSELVGYALDGFGIYGFRGEGGVLLTNEDLDECHGHTHEIEWDGQTVAMYHYHATTEFPYTVGCYRGTPIQARIDGGEGMGGQPPQGGNGAPPQGGTNGQPPQGGGQPPQGGNGQPPQGGNGAPPPPPNGGTGAPPPRP